MARQIFQKIKTREIAAASLLGALAALWEIIPGPPFDIPFPIYPPRISLDLTGIPMMISLLFYGPISGVYTSLIGCSIIFLRGNIPGGIFKLVAELATLLGFILLKKSIVARSILAVTLRVAVMTATNYFLLQLFYNMPESTVIIWLIPLALFNLVQALINIIPAYLIYLRISKPKKIEEMTIGVS
ncbi:ECF transporter S component [Candidatus Bathyarchaeota archaeon]|nr:ECF transporter S component [Candidatus Bathyarchaeota archaeon]